MDTPNGREYKTRSKSVLRPRSEWIAVPVPDCGVPPELVDAARNAVKDNRAPSSAGRRVFDLSGGVLHCAACGRRMGGSSVLDPKTDRRYFYYICSRLRNSDSAGCETKIRSVRADVLEPRIWEFVSGLILEPGRLRRGLDAMIEEEERASRGDPGREAKLWHEKLQEADRMRSGYQDLAARGLLTYEEPGRETRRPGGDPHPGTPRARVSEGPEGTAGEPEARQGGGAPGIRERNRGVPGEALAGGAQ